MKRFHVHVRVDDLDSYGNDLAPRATSKPQNSDSCCALTPFFDECLLRRIESTSVNHNLAGRSRCGQ